jgi:hypothetical protein
MRRLSLCLLFSSAAEGWKRSLGIVVDESVVGDERNNMMR